MPESIDIFNMHQKIMDDYKHFVSSFITIKDKRIKEVVETEINQGKFWPEPLIQFNPSFEQGESAQSLCDQGKLPSKEDLVKVLQEEINPDDPEEKLKTFPLSAWLENRIALDENSGLLVRRKPMQFSQIA